MVFDWIVYRIRKSLETGVDSSSLPHIGVLDIFGFESFEENGLEQLLINYGNISLLPYYYYYYHCDHYYHVSNNNLANESLQLTFNQSVLQAEQELYIDEGMMITSVEYSDNSACVELISRSRDSIINTLDSVCRAPAPSEEKFNSILHQVFLLNFVTSYYYHYHCYYNHHFPIYLFFVSLDTFNKTKFSKT